MASQKAINILQTLARAWWCGSLCKHDLIQTFGGPGTSDSSAFSRPQQALRPHVPPAVDGGTGAALQLLMMFTVYDLFGVGRFDVTPFVAGVRRPKDGGRM